MDENPGVYPFPSENAIENEIGFRRIRPRRPRACVRLSDHIRHENAHGRDRFRRVFRHLEFVLSRENRIPVFRSVERHPRRHFRRMTAFERHGDRKVRGFYGLNDQLRLDRHCTGRKHVDGDRELYDFKKIRRSFRGFQNHENRRNPLFRQCRFAAGMIEILHHRRHRRTGRAHRPFERGLRLRERGREK